MIYYETGRWSLFFICRCQGSTFPRAVTWAIPSSVAAVLIHLFVDHEGEVDKIVSQAWFAISSVLGFLIVFRTQQGYSRYWEGASLLQSVKAYWLNATSNLVAFCSEEPDKQEEVERFQHLLVRLVSLLHCSALQSVSMMHDNDFEVIELSGLSADYVNHVNSHEHNKCFIVLQSVQQLIVEHIRAGVLDIAPPIVSRCFQELSNGIVALTNVRKITDIPFPFPYAQLVSVMLLISTVLTPIVTGLLMDSPHWAGLLTFISQFAFWSINYIAAEIEMPFGDDENDLPIDELQREMNECLTNLLHPLIEKSPNFTYAPPHHKKLDTMKCTAALEGANFWQKTKRACVYDAYATGKAVEKGAESGLKAVEKGLKKLGSMGSFIVGDSEPADISSPKEDRDVKDSSPRAGQAIKDVRIGKSAKDAKDVKDDNASDSSVREMCRLEVVGEHENPQRAPVAAPASSGVSSEAVVVEIQEELPPAKEAKLTCMSPRSSSEIVPKEEKSPGRLRQGPFPEDGGICQQLSSQSRHMEALLERIALEVEQIRTDGSRLSNGLLGVMGSPTHKRSAATPEAIRSSARKAAL